MRLTAILLVLATGATAQSFTEPQRGSELRTDLLDALRPMAEWNLGAPVEFVVQEMRVSGDVAFVAVWAQRPGGAQIDVEHSPSAQHEWIDWTVGDGPSIQALMKKEGRMWVAVEIGINPTERWYDDQRFCPLWHDVLDPDICGG
jgi:hypothetical protein